MKKAIKKALSVMLVVIIMLTAAPLSGFVGLELPDWLDVSINAYATSGTCGDGVTWSYDSTTYTLIVSGTGTMENFDNYSNSSPWQNYWSNYEDKIKTVVIYDGITHIGDYAFYSCESLTSVVIADSVTSIGNNAFYECINLVNITIPNSVTRIGKDAFYNTMYYNDVTNWESDILYIGNYLIKANNSVSGNCKVKDGTLIIANEAFYECNYLESVTISNSVTSIGDEAFRYCTNLTGLVIGNGVTSIGYYAFQCCYNLKNVIIPNSVTMIGDGAFSGCTSLISIIIPGSVTTTGGNAFAGCTSLTDIMICDGVQTIGYFSFEGCTNLKNITIPNSVTGIGVYAFSHCTSLTSITIPDSVSSIFSNAFEGCDSLKDVYYTGTKMQWNAVSIWNDNEPLLNATIHFNSSGNDSGTCRLDDLSPIDYLAFSQLSYNDDLEVSSTTTIRESLKDIWNDKWANNIRYGELYANIANWTACKFVSNSENGFAAYIFTNDYNEFVVAFRGSVSIPENWFNLLNPDWSKNDIPMFFGGDGSQIEQAFSFVKDIVNKYGVNSIHITGHSLGGALCDIVSARYNCKAHSFNAAPFLANAYYHHPDEMGQLFSGVDDWKFVDHVTESDFTGELSLWIKNYMIHEHNGSEEAAHSLASMIDRNSSNALILTPATPEEPSQRNSNILNYGLNGGLFLGTNYLDFLSFPNATLNTVAYGGNSPDEISTGIGNDAIIGGKGNDLLDGGYGKDSYYYHNGDGVDFIWDIDGEINVYLYEFDKNDKFEGIEHPGNRWLYCNDELILMISEENPINIYIYNNDKELIKTIKYNSKSRNPLRWLIACPVNVEIINDANNEVVYTLYDGTEGTYYTEYGYFYVYQDKNGDYVKIADLYEGYSIRIIGTDTGTMNVSVSNLTNSEYSSTFSAVNVPVTINLVATIEESDNEKYLIIDTDGDGNIDNRVQLIEEIKYNYTFNILTPSRTEIRHKDGIKLHANIEGTAPAGSYVVWTSNNSKFKTEEINNGNSLKIISNSNGKTTFTATLYSADGEVLAKDSIEMKSKAGFFDKIGSFFRSLFGGTKIYEN